MASPTVDFKNHINALKKAIVEMAKNSTFSATQMVKLGKAFDDATKESKELSNTLEKQFKISKKSADQVVKLKEAYEKKIKVLKEDIIAQENAKKSLQDFNKHQEKAKMIAQAKANAVKRLAKEEKELRIQAKKMADNAIREANARKKATEASRAYAVKIRIMLDRMKEAGVDTRKFAQENKKLIKAAKGSALAMDKLNRSVARANKTIKRGIFGFRNLRNATDNGGMSFSVFRSKLLLFNFAMAMGVRQIARFSQEAAKIEDMQRAFDNLAGGTGKASIVMSQLDKAVGGTMSQFDLLQQSNNALILGVSTNSKQMAEMFNVATRLGRAMGKDVKTSVESLITGIGRQSIKWLDNIGIMTRVGEANKAYAKQLKKNVNDLTDHEKKQAFLTATMKAARLAVANLPPEVENANIVFGRFGKSVDNAGVAIGEGLMPAVILATRMLTAMMNAINPARVQRMVVVVLAMGSAFLYMRRQALLASGAITATTFSLRGLTLAIKSTGIGGIVIAIGMVVTAFLEWFDVFEDGTETLEDANVKFKEQYTILDIVKENYEAAAKAASKLIETQEKGVSSLGKQLALLSTTNEETKMLINLGHNASDTERELIRAIVAKNQALKDEKEELEAIKKAQKAVTKAKKEELSLISTTNSLIDEAFVLSMRLGGADEKLIELKQLQIEANRALNSEMVGNVVIDATNLEQLNLNIDTTGELTQAQIDYKNALTKLIREKMRLIKVGDDMEEQKKRELALTADVTAIEKRIELLTSEKEALIDIFNAGGRVLSIRLQADREADAKGFTNLEDKMEWIQLRIQEIMLEKQIQGLHKIGQSIDSALNNTIARKKETLTSLLDELRKERQIMIDLGNSVVEYDQAIKNQEESISNLTPEVKNLTKEYMRKLEIAEELNPVTKIMMGLADQEGITVGKLAAKYLGLRDAIGMYLDKLDETTQAEAVKKARDSEIASLKSDIYSESFNLMSQFADAEMKKQDELMKNDIRDVRKSSEYKRAQKRGDNAAMLKLEKKAMEDTLPLRKKYAKQKLGLAVADIALSTAVSIMKAYRDYGPVAGNVPAALMLTLGILQTAAAYKANPIPEFQQGGLIGGKRHSQGGTMIEAEAGEFVMSRSAVQSVGLEGLNRMNEGGGGGSSVTVNVSGNVLSQDFVEGELAENIKEAIRRGTDFGIS